MAKFKSKAASALSSENAASGALTAVIIVTVLAINVIVFVISSAFGLSFTSTPKDETVITGSTDALFSEARADRKKVKISFCFSSEADVLAHATGAFVHKTAEEYEKRYPDFIEIDYLNLITGKNSKGENVDVEKYKTDMQGNETPLAKSSVIFECGKNYKVVTDTYTSAGFADFYTLDAATKNATSYNGEAFMASMIYWVTVNEHPTAYLTVGHSEQLDSTFLGVLSMAGYNLKKIDLKNEEVPRDAALLIISNPLSDFEKEAAEDSDFRTEFKRLKTYMDNGGNIYVSLDPYVKRLPVLESFVASYGIAFSETVGASGIVRNIVKDSYNAITTDGFTLVTEFADNEVANSVSNTVKQYSEGKVIIKSVAALELSKTAKPMLVSGASSELYAEGKSVDKSGSYCVAAYATAEAKQDKTSSLFVVPSIYTTVSDAFVTNKYSNKDFMYSLFDNLYGRDGMPYGCNVAYYDSGVLENLTMGTKRIFTGIILAVPVPIAIFGAALIVKRKNR